MKKFIVITISILFSLCGYSQTKSQIKEKNIASTTVWKYDFSSGKELKIKESFTRFNAKGLVVEEIDYNKEGDQKERLEYKYDELKNKIEEKVFDKNDKLLKTNKYIYKDELKMVKEVYNNKGKLVSKKVYVYEKD